MDAHVAIAPNDERTRHAFLLVLVAGLASAALYAATYWAQRAIRLNGLASLDGVTAASGMPRDPARLRLELIAYLLATAGLFAIYVGVVVLARRGGIGRGRASALALVLPVLFNVALVAGRPQLSIDVLSYLAEGHNGALSGGNPHLQEPREVVGTPFGDRLADAGWRPVRHVSPYGPLWTQVEVAASRLVPPVSVGVIAVKIVVVAASLGSALLLWLILGRVRPQARLAGTLAWLWNPMVVMEFAGEGHNDAVMVFFVLAALALAVHARRMAAVVAVVIAALVKYLPLVFLPALVAYLWRTRRSTEHFAKCVGAGLSVGLLVAAALYAPWWEGWQTFSGLRDAGRPMFSTSLTGAVFIRLSRFVGSSSASTITSLVLGGIFAAYLLRRSLAVRDAPGFLDASAGIALAYLLIASPRYWPWYAALPVALLVLSSQRLAWSMVLVLSVGSRLVAPLDNLTVNGFTSWRLQADVTTVVAIGVPLLLVLGHAFSSRRDGRWRLGSAASSPVS